MYKYRFGHFILFSYVRIAFLGIKCTLNKAYQDIMLLIEHVHVPPAPANSTFQTIVIMQT